MLALAQPLQEAPKSMHDQRIDGWFLIYFLEYWLKSVFFRYLIMTNELMDDF